MNRAQRYAVLLLAMLAVVAMLVAGCTTTASDSDDSESSAEESVAFPVTITDDAGREVTIETEPMRIVSLAPANTEIVAALGLTDRLVGVTTFDDYPPEVTELPEVGDFVAPNIEAIAAAEPDLILGTTGVQAETIVQLEELGAAVVAVDPQSLVAVFDAIVTVGEATGAVSEAGELTSEMQTELDEIEATVEGAEAPRTFLEIAQDPLFTAGPGTLLDDLIVVAGGTNVVAEEGYVGYSLEQLVADDPEVYLATLGSMSDPADLEARAGYEDLSAVAASRVYVLDDNLVSRPGPRVVEGVRQIAEALHPEAFE
jgi:iron complex transport system substrate-binding protein